MAIDLSTAGISVNYAAEATAGTRPTSGYTKLTGIKSIPELNPAPDTLETTTLDETEYKTYIPGLKDLGGALEFSANLTQADDVKKVWFCIVIPGLTKSLYFPGEPTPLGMPGAEVSAVLETTAYITATGAPIWEAKPTAVGV